MFQGRKWDLLGFMLQWGSVTIRPGLEMCPGPLLAESPFWDLGVAIPWGFWEFSSLTRDQTLAFGSERRVLTNRLPGNSHSWVTLRKFFHKLKPPFLHL